MRVKVRVTGHLHRLRSRIAWVTCASVFILLLPPPENVFILPSRCLLYVACPQSKSCLFSLRIDSSNQANLPPIHTLTPSIASLQTNLTPPPHPIFGFFFQLGNFFSSVSRLFRDHSSPLSNGLALCNESSCSERLLEV